MYDYVKIAAKLKCSIDEFKRKLPFKIGVDLATGEIIDNVPKAEYKNFTFQIFQSGRIEITGSLHKYWNDGESNFNDFALEDVRQVINELRDLFDLI